MAILKLPKVGTIVKYRTNSYANDFNSKGKYVGAYCDRHDQYYIILNDGQDTVNNYNFQYIKLHRIDLASLVDSDYEQVLDIDGNPIDDTKIYCNPTTGEEFKIFFVQESYNGTPQNTFVRFFATRPKGRNRGSYSMIKPEQAKLATPKPRLTKAQREALLDRNSALEYIFKICTGLGYDASLFSEEKVNELVTAFKTKTKSELNKIIMDFFDSQSQTNVVDFKDVISNVVKFSDKFTPIDPNVEQAKDEVAELQSIIHQYNYEIHRAESRLDEFNKRLIEYKSAVELNQSKLVTAETKLNDILANTNLLELRQKTIDGVYSGLNTVIKDIVEQSGGFYRLDSIYLLDQTDINDIYLLENVKVRFRTNRVFVRDFNAPRLCFDAGEFYVDWYPFSGSTRNSDSKYNPRLVSSEPPISPVRYKDNTVIGTCMHPHIRTHGHICWGEAYQTSIFSEIQHNDRFEFTGKPYIVFNKLKGIMLTYNGGSPFELLTNFLLKRDPTFKNRLETEYRNSNRNVVFFKNKTSGDIYNKMSEMYFNEIHDLSVISVRDSNNRLLDLENRSKAETLTVKTYVKRYVGISTLTPRGESDKRYLKLKNNQFVELKEDSQFTTTQEVSNVSL